MDILELSELVLTNTNKLDVVKKSPKNKVASVTIALIEATELENEPAVEEKSRLLYCRFRLGADKQKSKTAKLNENVVTWQEMFNLHLFDENQLEISLWEKDNFIGRNVLDISEIEIDKTHRMRLKLEDCNGIINFELFFLLTVSGKAEEDNSSEIVTYQEPKVKFKEMIQKHNAGFKYFRNMADVGWMTIAVYGARGLHASDCYCVLQLENERLQTQTIYKTSDPNWKKVFAFKLRDMASILQITVHHEKNNEVIGTLDILICNVNNGEVRWYALKDSTRREKAKGNHPRIMLQMHVYYNIIKASIQAINPKETVFMQSESEFSRYVLGRNWSRFKVVMTVVIDSFKVIKTLFEWESKILNFAALILWIVFWYIHEAWMFPLLLLIPFFLNRPPKYYIVRKHTLEEHEVKSSLSIIQKINSVTDMIQSVQNGIGRLAGLGESVKNLFNFTVPFLSTLAIVLIIVVSFVMYLIPPRYLFIAWGIKKYTRKLLRPDRVPNNEILDLLSRIPDDEILNYCGELPLEFTDNEDIDVVNN